MSPDEEVARLLATIVRQNADTQSAAIIELSRAGFGPTRIKELLGVSLGTAKVTVQRARAKGEVS
jgi:DNA-directed RNA polymerase specialized sigma24 family protein